MIFEYRNNKKRNADLTAFLFLLFILTICVGQNHKLYNGYFLFDSNTILVYNQMVTM